MLTCGNTDRRRQLAGASSSLVSIGLSFKHYWSQFERWVGTSAGFVALLRLVTGIMDGPERVKGAKALRDDMGYAGHLGGGQQVIRPSERSRMVVAKKRSGCFKSGFRAFAAESAVLWCRRATSCGTSRRPTARSRLPQTPAQPSPT